MSDGAGTQPRESGVNSSAQDPDPYAAEVLRGVPARKKLGLLREASREVASTFYCTYLYAWQELCSEGPFNETATFSNVHSYPPFSVTSEGALFLQRDDFLSSYGG